MIGHQEEESPAGRPPSPRGAALGRLDEASEVGHDLVLGQMQVELQGHQHRELKGYELPAVHSELLFQFLKGVRTCSCLFIIKKELQQHINYDLSKTLKRVLISQ